ncbi:hypothetical protein [Brevibacillus laterosporus]|uniref:hypothetical protein n=1 Tax=Brevibacillus laterosporus TaxID=1465 RepID=UPI0003B2262B|nr:hypothetical protein [Brevibacillus laterosporus]ERM16729.1 hypothetical protein P615_22270 [Brevibacillus laterosporus PE36]
MEIIKHKLNWDESEHVYNVSADQMEMKQCYSNVFYASLHFKSKFIEGDWKVAYGYMPSVENIMVRHCFIVNEIGEAIDPTKLLVERVNETDDVYVSFKIFETYQEYISVVENNNCLPDLIKPLMDLDTLLRRSPWADSSNKIFIG